jgi:hypothetical protein
MTAASPVATSAQNTFARIQKGLRMLTVPLPHLAGLAAAVRVNIDARVPTMGVFASGRLVANPEFTARINDNELVFVLAPAADLALRTTSAPRAVASSSSIRPRPHHQRHAACALACTIPAGGLDMPGAREKSAEQIVVEMRRNGETPSRTQVWEGEVVTAGRVFGPSTSTGNRDLSGSGDVLGERREREMFPDESADQDRRAQTMGELAAKGLRSAAKAMGGAMRGRGSEAGDTRQVVDSAARHLQHAMADGAANLAGRRGARRADLRAAHVRRR